MASTHNTKLQPSLNIKSHNHFSLISNSQFLNVPTAPFPRSLFLHYPSALHLLQESANSKRVLSSKNSTKEHWNGTCYGRVEVCFRISLQCNLIYNLQLKTARLLTATKKCTLNIRCWYKSFLHVTLSPHSCPTITLIQFDDVEFFAVMHWYGALA